MNDVVDEAFGDIDAREERGPMRTCIASRAVRPLDDMLRFVIGPDGSIVPDLKRKLPGRGVWITATKTSLAEAIRRKAFARSFRQRRSPISVPDHLIEDVDRLMEGRALQALAFANKAGAVTSGATKVETAIAAGGVVAVVHARDAGPDGVRKIEQALRRRLGSGADLICRIDFFDSDQLSLALGRANVIHAALIGSGACQAVLEQVRRLAFYRTGDAACARRDSAEQSGEAGGAAQRPSGGEANERAEPWDLNTHE